MTGDSRDHLGERGVSPWLQREEVRGENAEPAGLTQPGRRRTGRGGVREAENKGFQEEGRHQDEKEEPAGEVSAHPSLFLA